MSLLTGNSGSAIRSHKSPPRCVLASLVGEQIGLDQAPETKWCLAALLPFSQATLISYVEKPGQRRPGAEAV